MSSLPIIDLSSWTTNALANYQSELSQAQRETAKSWCEIFQYYGFAIVVGHGIDENDCNLLNSEALSFFQEDKESKMSYNHGYYGNPSGGYTPPGFESVELSVASIEKEQGRKSYDPVENFVFTSNPVEYKKPTGECHQPFPSAPRYYQQMTNLLQVIHFITASALDIPNLNYFQKFYENTYPGHESMGENGNALRITHYPGNKSSSLTTNNITSSGEFSTEIRYGAHTDYQGYTILRPDKHDWHQVYDEQSGNTIQFGGLEAKGRHSKEWVQVKIPMEYNALVVNAGDLIQYWTNGQFHSPLHRVVNPSILSPSILSSTVFSAIEEADSSASQSVTISSKNKTSHEYSRQSIVFFSGPLDDCIVEPLAWVPHDVTKPPILFPSIRSKDHLLMKINRTNDI